MATQQTQQEKLKELKKKVLVDQKLFRLRRPEVLESKKMQWDPKWLKKKSDITDYFNYGFNEHTLELYCRKLDLLKEKTVSQLQKQYKKSDDDFFFKARKLNDNIPMDYGGLSTIYNEELVKFGLNNEEKFEQHLKKSLMKQCKNLNFEQTIRIPKYPMKMIKMEDFLKQENQVERNNQRIGVVYENQVVFIL